MIFSLFWGGGVYSKGGVYSRGSVYFKLRDFRGAFIRGGVYPRRGVYSRKYGIVAMQPRDMETFHKPIRLR